ncbi:hypothetical protein FRC12_014309 [Ceratobasidium sp. 428]|nr:hypothetical protein FRC12_014309 [Ceratobasidium sp. 428]
MTTHPTLIAIFGATGTGKTTFVNDASGGTLEVGHDLQACTQDVALSNGFQVDGRDVGLIDTPGFDDTELSDTEILLRISGFLSSTSPHGYEAGHKLTGIIYLHRITDDRMGAISRRTFRIFRELCGQKNLSNVLIVTNKWSNPPSEAHVKRQEQLRKDTRYFQPAIKAGAQLVRRLHKDTASAHDIIRMLLNMNPVVMKVQQELVDNRQGFFTTGAAQVLGEELVNAEKRHEDEIAQVKEELRKAKEEKDAETQQDLREFLEQAKIESSRLAKEIEALRHGFDEERARWENRIDAANRERDAAEKREFELYEQLEELRRQAELAREEDKWIFQKKIDELTEVIKVIKNNSKSWGCIVM